jgi:hypothetical protein
VLPDDELDAIRSEADDWLPDTAVVYTLTETDQGGGEVDTSYVAEWTGKGRIAPLASTDRVFSDAVKNIAESVVTLPYDAPVTERSTLSVAGILYNVESVSAGHSYAIHTRVAVVRVR